MKLFVGNLPFQTNEQELRELFAQHGSVGEVSIPTDQYTGRARGFAFVEMADDSQARAAIETLNGTNLGGRTIAVNEARPRTDRAGAGGRGSGGKGGYGRDRGGNRGGGRGERW